MTLLSPDKILQLLQLGIRLDLPPLRDALLAGLDPAIRNAIPTTATPSAQLNLDINTLCALPRTAATQHPFLTWIETARALLDGANPAAAALDEFRALVLGALVVPQAANGAPHDPLEDVWLFDSVPMLDRDVLRGHLRRLADGGRLTTLVVQGPTGSGRTRVADLVDAAWRDHAHVAIVAETGRLAPRELLDRLRLHLAPPAEPPGPMSEPLKVAEVTSLVGDWIKRRGGPVWLVLDDLEMAGHWTLDLVAGLISVLSQGSLAGCCRFVLLGLSEEQQLRTPAGTLLRETLAHDSVTVEDVTEFVRWVYTERLRQQVLDEEIAVTVSQILPPQGVTGAEYLRALGARAEQVAAKLIRDLGTP